MLNPSSSKVRKESQSLKESSLESKVSSQQSTEEMGSEDSDRCEPNSTEEKHWYELLKEKIGFDINAKKWMEEHPELAYENKSELLIRLACEVCLAKNTKYDPENENEEQNNKYIRFDSQRIFALFEVANPLIDPSDRKNFVEFICQKGNVQLLEMICEKERKDKEGSNDVDEQYKWKGMFTGYSKLMDLLQYVIDNQCPQEIVLCIVKKVYGYAHIFYNGEQYLETHAVVSIKRKFNYQDSVVKELLKQAIKLGYKDTVSVMLSGDIYHSIRLIKWKMFKEKPEFIVAYDVVKETVADVINSWLEDKQSCKDDLQRLLDQGIEIDLHKMDKEGLIFQLECLREKVISKGTVTKKKLVQELEKLGKKKGEVILRSTIVGTLISTLFFNYQDKVMEGGLFILKIRHQDNSRKGKILKNLNKKISEGESIEDIVLELIKSLHLGNHITNNWFFREVLAKVVNENLDKLKAVCAAICKEPMEELLKGEEIHENVTDVLQFFGVEVLTNQIVRSEVPSSCASIADYFTEDVKVYCEKEAKEDCSSDELAFSGLTRKIIRELEEKQDLTDKEKKDLVSKAFSKIKEGINILADGTATSVDVKDIFLSFELINNKITKEKRREIVEFVCQKGNVQLLEMICQKESKDLKSESRVENQCKWQGTFTGYSKLIDLLQYVIDNQYPQEIVLCIAKKIYGYAHVFYNGEQYLGTHSVTNMKRNFNYQDSVVKEFLKKVIKLGYKDAVSVMLSGDIYHCIRLMKWEVFQKKPEFIEAYDMLKETVADVISSWEESCKDDLRRLLDQGIKIELHKMDKESLILQLEYLGKEVKEKANISKEKLVKELEGLGEKKGNVRLRTTIVGALISTLFFNYQDKLMKGGPFTLKTTLYDNSGKEKILKNLNKKISEGKSIEDIVLELIQSLSLCSYLSNNWFFREVLAKVVNENLDKLKAVCAAICKEPMEELLRGEEVHENVIDVLQFFGVEKDFLLLKTNVVESVSGVSVRNSKSIDESLSDRSEESISSSSRQSFADARLIRDEYSLTLPDPQKISTAVSINQERKSLPNISSESKKTQQQLLARKSIPFAKLKESSTIPASEVAQRNNEGLIQNYYGQGGKADYSIKQVSSSSYLLSGKYSYVGGRMEEDGMLSKICSKQRSSLRKNSSGNRLPRVSSLDEAHCERYRKLFLNKIFSYNRFVDLSALLSGDQNLGLNISSSTSSGSSPLTSPSSANDSMDRLYDCDPYLDAVQEYIDGVQLLKGGDEDQGKNKIRSAASKKLEAAMYAYAIINFKEAIAGNIRERSKKCVKPHF